MAGRILVLDDEENYAEMLQELLREHDYRVDMATRPERAIDQLEEIPYDLVISDYKMPVMDGADFLKRARELYPNLPFILVSGLMNTPELVKVANMSVTLVMEKPLDTGAFLQHVGRFSAPMTAEEKEVFASQPEDGAASAASISNYPEEPRYFSAGSAASKRFMQHAWSLCQEGTHCFMLEPVGGEAELAAKDISAWRGNADKPVLTLSLTELLEGGFQKISSLSDASENSHVVVVRLASLNDIQDAQAFLAKAVSDRFALLFVFVVSMSEGEAAFAEVAGDLGLILPALFDRPSDVAEYARRFARLASERMGKPASAEFSAEAAYALLAYNWSSYKQIQEVITQAVADSADEPIAGDLLCAALDLKPKEMPSPDRRLVALMRRGQSGYMQALLDSSGLTAAELAKSLELDGSVQTKDDLFSMPLIKPELSKF